MYIKNPQPTKQQLHNQKKKSPNKPPPPKKNQTQTKHTNSKYSFVSFEFLLERKIAEVWGKTSLHYHSQQVEK